MCRERHWSIALFRFYVSAPDWVWTVKLSLSFFSFIRCWRWLLRGLLTWGFYFSIYQQSRVTPINPYPAPLPASQFLPSSTLRKLLAFFFFFFYQRYSSLQNECRCSSKIGGQGDKRRKCITFTDTPRSVLCGELPTTNESAGRRGGDKVSGHKKKKKKKIE